MPSTLDVEVDSDRSRGSMSSLQPYNPRRVSAKDSVSLLHADRQDSRARTQSPSSSSATQQRPELKRPSSSPSSLKPHIGKDDSGESSNADKWFEKSNNHASRNSTSYVDNSPPFFLQNSSSEETPPTGELLSRNRHLPNADSSNSLHFRAGLLNLATDNSSTEDFRSVIDDLTIENRKLKRKLKGYQSLQDSHLKDQKLFEVRFHSLSVTKKRELEDVLRKFALGLTAGPGAEAQSQLYSHMAAHNPASNTTVNMPSSLPHQKSESSSASNAFNDSAYASASASGQGSSGVSGSDSKKKSMPTNSSRARHHNMSIQSFLHDIPEGLLPRHSASMSDKVKRKLVVRRLEQIFAGRGVGSRNEQAGQQQELSQLAAKADRHEYYETHSQHAPKEGIREATIMQGQEHPKPSAQDKAAKPLPLTKQTLASAALEQRPTRPLDLDPNRAQVPSENYKYMQHLGFSPPGADWTHPYQDGHGWIYLNLLSSMAQLHTINVTPEFVRKAIEDHSKKFELSEDGRKIRWKGGHSVTKNSSDGDTTLSISNSYSGSGGFSSDRGSPHKRLKLSDQATSESGSKPSSGLDKVDNRLAYTPLFHHRNSNDSDESSSEEDEGFMDQSPFPMALAGDSSGMTSSGIKTASSKRNRLGEAGPIIFYNNARFCTDLSGDPRKEESMMYNAYLYHSIVQDAIGAPVSGSSTPNSETKGALSTGVQLPEAMDLMDNPIPAAEELSFPSQSPMSSQTASDLTRFDFEVSGLGGVRPADNFKINVKSMHARLDDKTAPMTGDHSFPSRYPDRIANILKEDKNHSRRKARTAYHKVLDARHEKMAPSRLPDPSCFMNMGDTSPEDEDMSDDDAMSDVPISGDVPAPAAAPQLMELDYVSTEESSEDEDDDYSDNESDGSLDLLATARELDPAAIQAQERQYDANMADRLAEEIPAGSSAATAGGGSGFASPASNVDRAEWEAAKRSARERDGRRKRSREEDLHAKIEATKH